MVNPEIINQAQTKRPKDRQLPLTPVIPESVLSQDLQLIDAEFLEAATRWSWKEEVHSRPDLGLSVAFAFYGQRLEGREQIYQSAIVKARQSGLEGVVPDVTEGSGFSELYQLTSGLSTEQYMLVQQTVARELFQQALQRQGISASEVDLLIVATSVPLSKDYAQKIRAACGIPDEVEIVRATMACNSSGWARAQVESGRFDHLIQPRSSGLNTGSVKNVALIAIDDPNRLDDRGGDPISPQFFSTGAAAMLWKYDLAGGGGTFRQLAHVDMEIPDGMEYLKVMIPYKDWGLTEEADHFFIAPYLHEAADGKLVEMDGRVGVFFRNGAVKIVRATLDKYLALDEKNRVADIKLVVAHHPSHTIFQNLFGKLKKLGFTESQFRWVINEGNVPVATMPMALARQMTDLNPGDRIMFLTFGAGGSYTCSIDEIGSFSN